LSRIMGEKMKVFAIKPFRKGVNQIVERMPGSQELPMDFAMLVLAKGQVYESDAELERVFLLVGGEAALECEDTKAMASRRLWRHDPPVCLSVCRGCPVKITGFADRTEIAVFMTENRSKWPPALIGRKEMDSVVKNAGVLDDSARQVSCEITGRRRLPASRISIEEVLLQPGRWDRPQPVSCDCPGILFVKYYPDNGFGISCVGKRAYYMDQDSAIKLRPGEVRISVCAPGYAQYTLAANCHPE